MKQKKRLKNKALPKGLLQNPVPISWDALTDADRTRNLMDCTRLADSDTFIARFGSWENPNTDHTEIINNK